MELVRRAYGAVSAQYIELFGNTDYMHAHDLELITRRLSIRPGCVLDVGCGPGHLTEHLRLLNVDATGIDVVPQFIEHARNAHPSGRYELGSMQQLPAADGSVAGILAWYSLIHLLPADLDGVLDELRRAMQPGGTLVIGFFHGDASVSFDHSVATAYYWPVEELVARLTRAGFTEIERQIRPGVDEPGRRPEGVIVANASSVNR